MVDKYASFDALRRGEREDVDYRIRIVRREKSGGYQLAATRPQKVHADKKDGAGEPPPELRGKDRQASARALSKREEALEAATTRP